MRGTKYLRWALFEAALNACDHPLYKERYERTKKRLGRQRGPKVAQMHLSRKLTEAIWHMLTRNQPFASVGAPFRLEPPRESWRPSPRVPGRFNPLITFRPDRGRRACGIGDGPVCTRNQTPPPE